MKVLNWQSIEPEDTKALNDFALYLKGCCKVMTKLYYMEELNTASTFLFYKPLLWNCPTSCRTIGRLRYKRSWRPTAQSRSQSLYSSLRNRLRYSPIQYLETYKNQWWVGIKDPMQVSHLLGPSLLCKHCGSTKRSSSSKHEQRCETCMSLLRWCLQYKALFRHVQKTHREKLNLLKGTLAWVFV